MTPCTRKRKRSIPDNLITVHDKNRTVCDKNGTIFFESPGTVFFDSGIILCIMVTKRDLHKGIVVCQDLWQKRQFLALGHEKIKRKWLHLAEICGKRPGYSYLDMKKSSTRGCNWPEFVANGQVIAIGT